jgi:hypothetical protein
MTVLPESSTGSAASGTEPPDPDYPEPSDKAEVCIVRFAGRDVAQGRAGAGLGTA